MDEKSHRHCGFVLIELVVIIAILAILAALLAPVYANARKRARQARCAASLHQIGAAVVLYQSDHDGGWPTAAAAPWGIAFAPYLRADYVKLGCTVARRGSGPVSHVPGYALNSRLYFHSARDPEVQFPSRTVAFCDAPWDIALTASPDPWMAGNRPFPEPEKSWIRHLGGANYLFCDQHIKWYRAEAVLPAWIHNRRADEPGFAVAWAP